MVVMGGRFFVLKTLVELINIGVFSLALIKKKCYWKKYLKGDDIKASFNGKDLRYFDAIRGELKNEQFYINRMKEPEYVPLLYDHLWFQILFRQGSSIGLKLWYQYKEGTVQVY